LKQKKEIEAKKREVRQSNIVGLSTNEQEIRDTLSVMSNKQIESLGKKTLTRPEVLQNLTSKHFEHIAEKSEMSDSDREEIKKSRLNLLKNVISGTTRNSVVAQRMIRNMEGDELAQLDNSYLNNPELIRHLTINKMKKMDDIDPAIKIAIGNMIRELALVPPGGHQALNYINNGEGKGSWG